MQHRMRFSKCTVSNLHACLEGNVQAKIRGGTIGEAHVNYTRITVYCKKPLEL